MHSQKEKAKNFLELHRQKKILILPNIWDSIGARILEQNGYRAAATASIAVAESLGYRDGENIKFSTLLGVLRRIAGSVAIPVTADLETGYARTLSMLFDNILQILEVGIVGINIEDGLKDSGKLRSVFEQCERIALIRETSDNHGIHLVINARIDCFISQVYKDNEARMEETIARSQAYLNAGADSIFPVGLGDIELIKTLRKSINQCLNITTKANGPTIKELEDIGINRVSFGPYLFRSCLRSFVDAVGLISCGNYKSLYEKTMTGNEVNKYLIQHAE